MQLVQGGEVFVTIEDALKRNHIKEGILSSQPKTTGAYVTPSFVLCVSTPGLEGFSIERLKDWFDTSVTNISQEVGQDISILVVSYAWISSLVTSHGVVNREH